MFFFKSYNTLLKFYSSTVMNYFRNLTPSSAPRKLVLADNTFRTCLFPWYLRWGEEEDERRNRSSGEDVTKRRRWFEVKHKSKWTYSETLQHAERRGICEKRRKGYARWGDEEEFRWGGKNNSARGAVVMRRWAEEQKFKCDYSETLQHAGKRRGKKRRMREGRGVQGMR